MPARPNITGVWKVNVVDYTTPLTEYDLLLSSNAYLASILTALGGVLTRIDALETGKADITGFIEIEGTVDDLPAVIAGAYEIE
jgi:hypothetical protein